MLNKQIIMRQKEYQALNIKHQFDIELDLTKVK